MAELDEILERPRDEKGRFAGAADREQETVKDEPVIAAEPELKAEPKVEPKAEPKQEPPPGFTPKDALVAERRKRQELEQRLREYEASIAPSREEDLPGYVDHKISEVRQEAQNRFYDAVEAAARTRYKDYDEKRQIFLEAAQNDPMLRAQLSQARDPAEFAYQKAIEIQELQDVGGSILKYREKIEKQIREQLAKEQPKQAIPQSLNGSPSPVTTTVYQGPPALGGLLRNNF